MTKLDEEIKKLREGKTSDCLFKQFIQNLISEKIELETGKKFDINDYDSKKLEDDNEKEKSYL